MLILNAIERGWFAETGAHSAQHQNTATGIAGDLGILRAFIVFEMPQLNGSITGASLRLELEAYLSGEESETFMVMSVNTPARAMGMTYLPGAAAGQAIFDDLGNGSIYGHATVTADDVGRVLEISLSAQAQQDMQAAAGALFAIGIQLGQIHPPQAANDTLKMVRFSAASENRTQQLILQMSPQRASTPSASGDFGLQYDLSNEQISEALRQVVSTQAKTLETMLQSMLDVVVQARDQDGANERGGQAEILRQLLTRTSEQLSRFADNHVRVEQRIGEALTDANHSAELSPACMTLLNDLEQVNAVLHANISVARRYLDMMREQHVSDEEARFDTDDFEL
jgi:hypothetical protein